MVTTDAGGIPYILTHEETGLMVKCGDHQALAASAMRLLEDRELASRLARNARESACRFTWPAVRDEWLSLYAEVTGRKESLPAVHTTGRREPVKGIDDRAADGMKKEL